MYFLGDDADIYPMYQFLLYHVSMSVYSPIWLLLDYQPRRMSSKLKNIGTS